ncbi:MAG: TSUP family transporter [Verrucomicrobiota bacterium]
MEIQPITYLLAAGLVASASVIQGIAGFAFGLICVPFLSILFSPPQAVSINFIIGSVNVLVILAMLIRKFSLRRMAKWTALSMLCAIPSTFLITSIDRSTALFLIGASIVLVATLSMSVRRNQSALFRHPVTGYGASMLSGFIMGAFSLAGPPMLLFLSNSSLSQDEIKADMQFYFLALSLFILPFYLHSGVLTFESARIGLALSSVVVPFTALGVMLGRRIPRRHFVLIVDLGLIVLGIFLAVKNATFF